MPRPYWLITAALTVTLTLLAFGESIGYGFHSDDFFLILNNLSIRAINLENLKTVFTTFDPELYIPLIFASYMIDHLIGGLDPTMFHVTNLLLHIGNTLLVVWILRNLKVNQWIALFCGLLFAVHPLNTEAVVWLSGRKDLLASFFALASLGFYLKDKTKLSVVTFLLGLLAKASIAPLPAVLLLHHLLIEQKRLSREYCKRLAPYILLSITFLLIAVLGKQRVIDEGSLLAMALMAGRSTVFYIQKFLLPTNLSIVYPYRETISVFSLQFSACSILVIATLGFAFKFRKKYPVLLFSLLSYLALLSLSFPNYQKAGLQFIAVDRYAYLPSLFLLLLLAGFISRLKDVGMPRSAMTLIGIGMLVPSLGLARAQTRTWSSPEVLWNHALEVSPESVLVRLDLARIYREQGKYQQAFAVLQDGLKYGEHIQLTLAAGAIYARVGQIEDAREQFEKAKQMDTQNPEPYFYHASLEQQLGRDVLALGLYARAVELDGSYVLARARLADLLLGQGKLEEARAQLEEALEWNKSSLESLRTMGKLLLEEGRTSEAQVYLKKTLELDPADTVTKNLLTSP